MFRLGCPIAVVDRPACECDNAAGLINGFVEKFALVGLSRGNQ
jgi:hypothetical protein